MTRESPLLGEPAAGSGRVRETWRRIGFPLAVALLLAWMGIAMVRAALLDSQTWDEAIHISAGYIYWKTGDYRYNSDHPIFGKMLNALPLLALDLKTPADAQPGREIEAGRTFLYANRAPADLILFLARGVTIALTLAFGLVLALWARWRFGGAPALLTLVLFASDPNMLAHGHLVTTDMSVTVFLTVAVLAWDWYLAAGGPWRLAAAGVLAGLALACKMSALALAPLLVVLYFAFSFRNWRGWKHAAVSLGWLAAYSALTLALIYSRELLAALRHAIWNTADLPFVAQQLAGSINQATPLGRLLHAMALASGLPAFSYVAGLLSVVNKVGSGHHNYLLGHVSQTGWWYYFPVLFAVKTPVTTLLLSALSLAALRRRAAWEYRMLLIPAVLLFGLGMLSKVNIGLRHILPVYPFLMLLGPAVFWRELGPRLGRALPLMAALASAGVVAESMAISPHYLAFFNFAAGGPARGMHYAVDSNLDWGQDLRNLRIWFQERGRPPLCISYFGTAPIQYYIAEAAMVSLDTPTESWARDGCYAAVSATGLSGVYHETPTVAKLRKMTPIGNIGHSIYLFDLMRVSWDSAGATLAGAPPTRRFAHAGIWDDDSPLIEFQGRWEHTAMWSDAMENTVSYSDQPDSSLEFWFDGSGLEYVYTRAPNRGVAGLTIDDAREVLLDQYSPRIEWRARWIAEKLTPGRHHLKVRVLAKKNRRSSGAFVDVDALIVR